MVSELGACFMGGVSKRIALLWLEVVAKMWRDLSTVATALKDVSVSAAELCTFEGSSSKGLQACS